MFNPEAWITKWMNQNSLEKRVPELETIIPEEVSFDSIDFLISVKSSLFQLFWKRKIAQLQSLEFFRECLHALLHTWKRCYWSVEIWYQHLRSRLRLRLRLHSTLSNIDGIITIIGQSCHPRVLESCFSFASMPLPIGKLPMTETASVSRLLTTTD